MGLVLVLGFHSFCFKRKWLILGSRKISCEISHLACGFVFFEFTILQNNNCDA